MKKKIFISLLAIIILLIAGIILCDRLVDYEAKDRLYDKVEDVPHRKVGMVLGTSPISTWNGRRNYYFDHRIKAAADSGRL